MSPLPVIAERRLDGFPRVSGDEPPPAPRVYPEWEFSPRERG